MCTAYLLKILNMLWTVDESIGIELADDMTTGIRVLSHEHHKHGDVGGERHVGRGDVGRGLHVEYLGLLGPPAVPPRPMTRLSPSGSPQGRVIQGYPGLLQRPASACHSGSVGAGEALRLRLL